MFDPFDFNKDGKLDLMEGFLKYQTIMGQDEDAEEDLENELEMNGLDRIDLELMDEDERREAIEDAGLDPDDYEELFD